MTGREPRNPLIAPVLETLRQHPLGLSEYELLQEIAPALPPLAEDATLALFQKHFLVMNALYRLQLELADEGFYLSISPLAIRLEPTRCNEPDVGTAPAVAPDQPLRDYYLDWEQFRQTGSEEVEQLLAGFWQRFHAADAVADALITLDLPATADWPTVHRQYRRLAGATHPDRGGDPEQFLAVRGAYEQLRLHFGRAPAG